MSASAWRRRGLTAAFALALPALPAPGTVAAAAPDTPGTLPCSRPVDVPGQGLSCPVDGGWLVLLRDGSTVFTHGPDPHRHAQPASGSTAAGPGATPSNPVCVTTADYGVHVVYAVPSDKPNRYSTMLSTIRDTVREMNGRLNEAGLEAGGTAVDLRVVCDSSGAIAVADEQLPTPSGADSFDTISTDLRARGYASTKAKYLVLYDDPVGSFSGQGSIDFDDRPTADNLNNVGPDYAMTYNAFAAGAGVVNSDIPLHELGHNLGAVQTTAPHSSGSWHCNDGWDVMCYRDGGITQCTTGDYECINTCFDYEHFDCGHDDYFHTAPASGNWLATHWNLGSTVNRFFRFGGGGTSTDSWRQEAEAFGSRPVGGQCSSSTASGGLCWNLWSNGSISTTTTSLTAQTKTVKVVALGDPAGGVWPQMEVYVDGVRVMNVGVTDDVWLSYSAAVTLSAGTHTIEVRYTNDGVVDGNDRNLLVDYASVAPATRSWVREAESFTTKTAGGAISSSGASGGAYWNLWSNGYIEHAMSVPYTSQHEVQVVARGDVAGGVWPQMKVYVDGALVLTQTVATTSWTSYRVRRTLSGGSHTLRVEFTNDAVVGGEDRNLKLDYAALHS